MKFAATISIKNRKASFEYALLDKFTAGIILAGTEIKSIRLGQANIADSFCVITKGEVFVRNLEITPYELGGFYNHEAKRDRKLLLSKNEIKKIGNKLKDQGITLVPLNLFVNEAGLAKLEIAIAKGKKLFDKRESLKDRDVKRDLDRRFKA